MIAAALPISNVSKPLLSQFFPVTYIFAAPIKKKAMKVNITDNGNTIHFTAPEKNDIK